MELNVVIFMALFIALPNHYDSKQIPLNNRFSSLESTVQNMGGVIRELSHKLQIQGEEIKSLKARDTANTAEINFTPGTYMKSISGCLSDEISLTCPTGQTIFMDKAEYGEYSRGCTSTCCTPHPYDCVESMTTSNADEWLILKLTCDNKTSCNYLFQGSTFVEACTVSNAVNYINLFYTCLPVSSTEPVGFTAFNTAHKDYNASDIVIFDGILSNIGNYYNENSGIFICPLNGYYIIGVDILTNWEKLMSAQLMRDSTAFSTAYADNTEKVHQSGSTTSIVECNTGQKIWVRSPHDNTVLHGSNMRYSSFFGYLLYRQL